MRRLPLALFLLVAWVALWEDVSWANTLSGVVVVAVVLAITPEPRSRGPVLRVRPVALLHFFLTFVWKLVEANAIVAWETVTPWNRLAQGIVAVPLRGGSPWVTTVVANSVSLTPGTLSLELVGDPPTLYVHVLHLHDIDAVRRDILRMEALAIRAFGGDPEEDRAWTS